MNLPNPENLLPYKKIVTKVTKNDLSPSKQK